MCKAECSYAVVLVSHIQKAVYSQAPISLVVETECNFVKVLWGVNTPKKKQGDKRLPCYSGSDPHGLQVFLPTSPSGLCAVWARYCGRTFAAEKQNTLQFCIFLATVKAHGRRLATLQHRVGKGLGMAGSFWLNCLATSITCCWNLCWVVHRTELKTGKPQKVAPVEQ